MVCSLSCSSLTLVSPTSGYPSLDLYRYVYLVRAFQNCLHPFKKWGRGTFGTFGTLLDCASRNSRLLPQCRVEAKSCGRPPASLDCLDPNPAELFERTAGAVYLFRCGELGPVLAVGGAGRVAVAHLALADTLQQCSGSLHRRVLGGGVESSGVCLKVFTPGYGLKCRP